MILNVPNVPFYFLKISNLQRSFQSTVGKSSVLRYLNLPINSNSSSPLRNQAHSDSNSSNNTGDLNMFNLLRKETYIALHTSRCNISNITLVMSSLHYLNNCLILYAKRHYFQRNIFFMVRCLLIKL